MNFELHPNLAKKTKVIDLEFCSVFLENESNYPWLILVPRKPNVSRLIDLDLDDQIKVLKELDIAQRIIWQLFNPVQLNVAAIGNKTPQLHIHVIGRTTGDPAWPGCVWDHPARQPYSPEKFKEITLTIAEAFKKR